MRWLLPLLFFASSAHASYALQWALRFGEVRNHANALTGCYGTASYRYRLPSVDELRRHRKALAAAAAKAKLPALAWSSDQDAKRPGNVWAVDLSDGSARSLSRVGLPSPKAATFCRCDRWDMLFCTPSALPPLATPIFFTVAEDVEPAKSPHWDDPTTGLEWRYRYDDVCWARADLGCRHEGLRLPTHAELSDAAPRLRETGIGAWARRSKRPLWTADEAGADRESAWTLELDTGRSELRAKRECLQALCVKSGTERP